MSPSRLEDVAWTDFTHLVQYFQTHCTFCWFVDGVEDAPSGHQGPCPHWSDKSQSHIHEITSALQAVIHWPRDAACPSCGFPAPLCRRYTLDSTLAFQHQSRHQCVRITGADHQGCHHVIFLWALAWRYSTPLAQQRVQAWVAADTTPEPDGTAFGTWLSQKVLWDEFIVCRIHRTLAYLWRCAWEEHLRQGITTSGGLVHPGHEDEEEEKEEREKFEQKREPTGDTTDEASLYSSPKEEINRVLASPLLKRRRVRKSVLSTPRPRGGTEIERTPIRRQVKGNSSSITRGRRSRRLTVVSSSDED